MSCSELKVRLRVSCCKSVRSCVGQFAIYTMERIFREAVRVSGVKTAICL